MTPSADLPLIAVTMGDPAGIGPEIAVKAFSHSELFESCRLLLLGDIGVLHKVRREVGATARCQLVQGIEEVVPGRTHLLSLSNIQMENFRFGESRTDLGLISTFYIVKAAELAVSGQVDAIVTGPINKAILHQAGYDYTGHTEMLKALTRAEHASVMLVGEHLKVVRVTSHAPIRTVADLVTEERVLKSIRLAHDTLRRDFGVETPHIGVCALNPHAGENGLFGREEIEQIQPAIQKAKASGLRVTGPLAADIAFQRARDGGFDVVVAMYHDQGHIAFRLLDFSYGVNVTLGLPIIRTSPDHGTAYDIAGKGYASERSMVKAIELAAQLARRRRERAASDGTPAV